MVSDDMLRGIAACIIASIGYGTMHVPIRRFPAGDGFFVQWAMSVGILIMGFIINVTQDFPTFQPIAVFGGILWTVANTISQRVISGLGLAVALLLWNTTNCITGWASGRFGMFGLKVKPPGSDVLNMCGLGCVLIGGFVIAFVRKTPKLEDSHSGRLDIVVPLERSTSTIYHHHGHDPIEAGTPGSYIPRPRKRSNSLPSIWDGELGMPKSRPRLINTERLLCIGLALIAGFFYGVTLTPIIYVEDHHEDFPNAPEKGIGFVFSHYFGVFIGSSTIFVVYALFRRNKPVVNPEIVLPSIVGGAIWGVSMAMMIISNDVLGQTITYPIITTVPGCVAALWSVFYFKEITTKRNFCFLGIAFMLICVGALMVVASKSIA